MQKHLTSTGDEYTLNDALLLARNLIHGPLEPAKTPLPTIDEAIEALNHPRLWTHTWLTGTLALEVLADAKNGA